MEKCLVRRFLAKSSHPKTATGLILVLFSGLESTINTIMLPIDGLVVTRTCSKLKEELGGWAPCLLTSSLTLLLTCSRGAFARSASSSQWSGPRRFSGQRAGLYRWRPALYYLFPFPRRRLSTAETLKLSIYIMVYYVHESGIVRMYHSYELCIMRITHVSSL